jgi:hypothetical protein
MKMTIEITKPKLMRWIIIAFILLCGAVEADDVPKVMLSVARYRDFMASFTGYEDYSLLDVYEWESGMYGVVMLCPAGIRETLVLDCRKEKKEIVYRDMYVPRKEKREEMRRESIPMSDAVRLARAALIVEEGNLLPAGN